MRWLYAAIGIACLCLSSGCREHNTQLAANSSSNTTIAPLYVTQDSAVLPVSEAHKVLKQCSRNTPSHVSSFWIPQADDIRQLESDAPSFLKIAKTPFTDPGRMLTDYDRQYVGLVCKGRKIIYVNAFSKGSTKDMAEAKFDWHTEAVNLCDGGPAFYGVEYDVEARQFSNLEFNGFA